MVKNFEKFINEQLNNPQIIAKPKPKGGPNPNRFNKLIDYTYLRDDADIDKIEEVWLFFTIY